MILRYIILSIILSVVVLTPVFTYTTIGTEIITVEDKERITVSTDEGVESYYLVYTDKGVYSNKDSFLLFKFSSSDLQNKLKEGKTYRVETNWFRVPFFSMYKNIIEIKGEL